MSPPQMLRNGTITDSPSLAAGSTMMSGCRACC